MARDNVGSILKVVLGGITFRAAADADIKDGKPAFKNSPEHTTGGTFRKMEAQDQTAEGVTLKVNADELEQLKALAESPEDITLAYTTIDGSTMRGEGFIDMDGRQTMTGKVEVKMTPRNGWTPFIA